MEKTKKALVLISGDDFNGVFIDIEDILKTDLNHLEYQLITKKTGSIKSLIKSIQSNGSNKKIDSLILVYHGVTGSMRVSKGVYLSKENIQVLAPCREFLEDNATILLYSCSVGAGNEPIAMALHKAIERDTFAPKFTIVPGTDLQSKNRVTEFALSEKGRLSFDYLNYVHYKSLGFKLTHFPDTVASKGYMLESKFNKPSEKNKSIDDLFLRLIK